MTNKKTIGELIEDEVRKQQMSITEFAKRICCQRNNVYDIFGRSKMDILQLKNISKVLKRNFFKELSEDLELINDSNESEKYISKSKAISQFLNVVPNVLHKLGKPTTIVFSRLDEPGYEDCPTPDFGLPNYFITFTVGDTLKERIGDCAVLPIEPKISDDAHIVEVCTNRVYDSVCVNIKVDYKTEEEWYKVLCFAFDIYAQFGKMVYRNNKDI